MNKANIEELDWTLISTDVVTQALTHLCSFLFLPSSLILSLFPSQPLVSKWQMPFCFLTEQTWGPALG